MKSAQSVVFSVISAAQVDQTALEQFLQSAFGPQKSAFLVRHGAWLYRGRDNQWVVVAGDQIVAYSAVIPTACAIHGQKTAALWWVDLVVAPAYRGRGIQTLIDQKVRAVADLKLGFPNELAAKIHRKHQWGVREDGQVLLLPLRPLRVKSVRRERGRRGLVLKLAAAALTPVSWALRRRYRRYRPRTARRLRLADPELLAGIFHRFLDQGTVTTYRDADYFRWRYRDAPYHHELAIYLAGPVTAPTHYLVVRQVHFGGTLALRILDLFGDFSDLEAIRELVSLALHDAVQQGADQVTIMNFTPELNALLRRLGFLINVVGRFCWHSAAPATMQALDGRQYWTLGDSDNDAPE